MTSANPQQIIDSAISAVAENSPHSTDGKWLEELTAHVAPHIREWDISEAYAWADWQERQTHFPNSNRQDIGIDVVARRRSDGSHIAIQCKSRQLDEHGRGSDIGKDETDKFLSTSSGSFWAERWLVTNGDNRLSNNARQALLMQDEPLKMINIHGDLLEARLTAPADEECPHCNAINAPPPVIYHSLSNRPEPVCRTKRSQRASAYSRSMNAPTPAAFPSERRGAR